jgi:hypothetical protein
MGANFAGQALLGSASATTMRQVKLADTEHHITKYDNVMGFVWDSSQYLIDKVAC